MMGTLRKTWALLAAAERRKAIPMLALIVLMALAETVGVVSVIPFLSVIARPEAVQEQPWLAAIHDFSGLDDMRSFTVVLGLASVVVVILSSAFKTVTLHLVNRYVYMLRHSLSTRLLSCYLHQPYEFFLERNPAELSKNVLTEADQLTFSLFQPLSLLLAHGAVVVAMVALIVAYDPQMAIAIVLAVTILYGIIYLVVRRRLKRVGHARKEADRGRYQACSEALGGIKDVKITNSAGAWLDAYARSSRESSRHLATADTITASPLYLVEAAGYSGLILIALFLMMRTDDVAQVLPALGMYGFAAYRLLPAVQVMYRGFARLRYSTATLETIHDDLAMRERCLLPGPQLVLRREIRLDGITYAYPSTPDRPVLRGLDLVIPANTSVGISGVTGSGKSTLMDILLGLLRPQAGTLAVDGVPITPVNLASWQRAIGYVPQHIYLADASVAGNIAFGVAERDIDMAAVERAARTAQIHDFVVQELPDGYRTRVGDRGIRLSGGQRQRVGIARALYRDPPVLLMDEATSALDSETENALNDALGNLGGRKTIVIIAHKETSLRRCDTVVELKHGGDWTTQ